MVTWLLTYLFLLLLLLLEEERLVNLRADRVSVGLFPDRYNLILI